MLIKITTMGKNRVNKNLSRFLLSFDCLIAVKIDYQTIKVKDPVTYNTWHILSKEYGDNWRQHNESN